MPQSAHGIPELYLCIFGIRLPSSCLFLTCDLSQSAKSGLDSASRSQHCLSARCAAKQPSDTATQVLSVLWPPLRSLLEALAVALPAHREYYEACGGAGVNSQDID